MKVGITMDRDYELELYNRIMKLHLVLGKCLGALQGLHCVDNDDMKNTLLAGVISDIEVALEEEKGTFSLRTP